jgi:hypothetical protein
MWQIKPTASDVAKAELDAVFVSTNKLPLELK